MVYTKGTASNVALIQQRDVIGISDQIQGMAIKFRGFVLPYYGMPTVSFESGIWVPTKSLTVSDILPPMEPKPIPTDEIVIVPLREIPRDYAKKEIAEYIQQAGGRKVYISELAEELRLDIDMIIYLMEELEAETRD